MSAISVLLVDDNPIFLHCAKRFLQKQDVVVVGTVSGGRWAIDLAQNLDPDVALIDLSMSDLPGLELIPLLRATLPKIGIIALTLMDTDDYRKAALAAGADDFVSKNTMAIDLLPAIQKITHGDETKPGENNGHN
ncbi:MAG: response regulator transcription factor [Anaerolineae bacterium]|nr:response regulator transcription factor [Anaerolineae bacterium]